MIKFVKKILIFIILFSYIFILLVLFDVTLIGNQYLGNYNAALIDKCDRIQSINSPKIILVGNSNVNFGFKSELIEKEFGMPVVNMGLHAGLGNAFSENMINLNLCKGDIVIVCHSSFSDNDDLPDPDLAWITLELHKDLWSIVRPKDYIPLFQAYPNYLLKAIVSCLHGNQGNIPLKDTCYSRSAFNEYGDICVRPDSSYEFEEGSVIIPQINSNCINRLNKLNKFVDAHGAVLLVAGYPIGQGEYTPSVLEFENFEKELRYNLDCEVISHYTDYFIPYEYFYNTNLHLNETGAEIRTNLLIKDLHSWKEGNGASFIP